MREKIKKGINKEKKGEEMGKRMRARGKDKGNRNELGRNKEVRRKKGRG